MALLRLIHAADMPDPASLMARLGAARRGRGSGARRLPASELPRQRRAADRFRGLVEARRRGGKHLLAQQLHDQVGLVRYAPPELVLKPTRPLGADWSRDLALALESADRDANGRSRCPMKPASRRLLDQEKIAEERVRAEVLADPNVRAVMDAFPDAELEIFSTRGA